MKRDILKQILMKDNVVESINENIDILLDIIPEIKDMIGFDHKHPHHHLDVWNHTLLALSLSPLDYKVRLALLLHDIGKPHSFQEGEVRHFKNHPLVSKQISEKILRRLKFEEFDINELSYLIENHDTPLTYEEISKNKNLAEVLFKVQFCDALAHHQDKLEKRIEYLLRINEFVNYEENKIEYERKLIDKRKK